MSGVGICVELLTANAALIAAVPATKIFAGAVPVNTELPAISVASVSGIPRNTVAMTETGKMVTERVQVTVLAKTYPLQKSYMLLVADALPNMHGTVNGFACDSIVPDNEGPDFYDDAAIIYEQSADFMVKFVR